jgi:hypothetical protein
MCCVGVDRRKRALYTNLLACTVTSPSNKQGEKGRMSITQLADLHVSCSRKTFLPAVATMYIVFPACEIAPSSCLWTVPPSCRTSTNMGHRYTGLGFGHRAKMGRVGAAGQCQAACSRRESCALACRSEGWVWFMDQGLLRHDCC